MGSNLMEYIRKQQKKEQEKVAGSGATQTTEKRYTTANKNSRGLMEHVRNEQKKEISRQKALSKLANARNVVDNFGGILYDAVSGIGLSSLGEDINSASRMFDSAQNSWQSPETLNNTKNTIQGVYNRLVKYDDYRKTYGGKDLAEITGNFKKILDNWDSLIGSGMSSEDISGRVDADESEISWNDVFYTTSDGTDVTWQELYDNAKMRENIKYWESIPQREDFAEKSKPKNMKYGEPVRSPLQDLRYTNTGYHDILYAYINGDVEAQNIKDYNDLLDHTDNRHLKNLSPDIVKTFNYIYNDESNPRAHQDAYDYIEAVTDKKYTGYEALVLGAGEGIGANSLADVALSIGGDDAFSVSAMEQEAARQNPELAAIGEVGGNILLNIGLAQAGSSVPYISKLLKGSGGKQLAGRMMVGAGAFGGSTAVREAGHLAQGDIGVGEYLYDVAGSGLSGAASSAVGFGAEKVGANILKKYGWQNNKIANKAVDAISDVFSTTTEVGVTEGLRYAKNPDEYELNWGDVALEFAVDAAFFAFSSFRHSGETDAINNGKARPHSEYFGDCNTEAELRTRLRELAKKNHPDRGGDVDVMAKINSEYTETRAWIRARDGANAYKRIQKAQKEGDIQTATDAKNEFNRAVNDLSEMVKNGEVNSAEAQDAVQILNTVAEQMGAEDVARVDMDERSMRKAAINDEFNRRVRNKEATEGELPIAEMQNAETEATNKRHVAQFAEKMERAGATVLTEMYGAETDPIGYIRDMMKVYSAGRKGADISTVEGVESINPAQVKAMYAAGVADSGRSSGAFDNAGQIAYTESNVDSGFSGVNNEVYFTAPDSNMPVAVGNLATQNNIVSVVQNFPDLTVSELATEFAPTSKEYRVLQAYIDAGYGNEIAAEVLNYNTQTNSEAMTENERKALVEYKSSESYKINAKLRGGVKLNSQETEFVNHVDSALEKLPVHRGAVYRNVVFDDFGGKEQFDAFMEVHQADGVPIIYYSYTSTSTVDDGYPVNGEYVAHMIINGQNGRNMDGIGNNFEKEVLFPRKSAFIVDKIEYGADGYPTIYMTEVTNEGQGYEGNIRRDNRGEQRTPADGQENTMWQVHQVYSKNDEMPGISKRNTDADNDTRRNVRQVSGEITEGNIYGEEVHLRRGGEWIDSTNTGRPIQGLEESSRRNSSREATSRPADSGAASLTYGEKVSTASLGIGGGTNAKTIRLVKGGNTAAIAEARAIAKQRGLRLVLFAGDNLDIRRDGEQISARAYISGDRMFVRVDHPTFTAAQLIKHEAGHDMIRKGEIDPNKTRARLEKTYGKDKLDYVSNLYAEAYASNGYNMTAEEIWEEVICDSLADMNVFDKTRNEVSAKEALGAIKADVAENKTPATRGPPIGVGAEGKASRDLIGKTFPPYNISQSDANEWATRWAHRDDIKTGDQTIVFYRGSPHLIEKYDSAELGYQIEKKIRQKEYNEFKELKNDELGKARSVKEIANEIDLVNFKGNSYDGRKRVSIVAQTEHRGENNQVQRVDKNEARRGQASGDRSGDLSSRREDSRRNRIVKKVPNPRASLELDTHEIADEENDFLETVQSSIRDTVREELDRMGQEYGWITKGENPAREVKIPRKTAKGKYVSQTVRTILEAKATPEEMLPSIEELVADGEFSYDRYTDKTAIADAENTIRNKGWVKTLANWLSDSKKGKISKEHTALGWALYNNAVNKGDVETAIDVLDHIVGNQRNAAQALQATRILKQLSPESQLYQVQRSVANLQEELNEKYGDEKSPELKIDEELAAEFLKAETQEARDEVLKDIYRDIGRQLPSRLADRWRAWRYLAMLGNPRTHIRNIVGNAGFAPVVALKNLTATAIESAVHRVSGGKISRTKAFVGISESDRDLLKAAWEDYANVADRVSNGGKYNDSAVANKAIEDGRRVFKSKLLEGGRKGNSKLLEVEDVWFAKPHYAYALAQYCKANNITADQLRKGKALGAARDYAIKEAQKATYKDTNMVSQFVSELGRNGNHKNKVRKAAGVAIEAILPFRKTPANILVRGVEYSPLGLLKSLSYDLVQVAKGQKSSAEVIDSISAGLTGTGLLALGVWLAAEGLVRGHGEDDEEKEFEELMGHQAYSLELPDGTSVTLDWLAPECLPFFVGVNLWEMTKKEDEPITLTSLISAFGTATEPMLEMSCLQGVNDLVESVGYASADDRSGLLSILINAATSYFTQGIPTLLGQLERTGEDERNTTFTKKDAFVPVDMQRFIGNVSAKIPGWDFQQIPYIDAWGRSEQTGGAGVRAFNNFINPSYTSNIEESEMEKELLRLYEVTGEGSVLPSRANKYFTVNGETKRLTEDEYIQYATKKGQTAYRLVTAITESKQYQNLDDAEKIDAIAFAYDYSNQVAKKAVSAYTPEKWVGNMETAKKTYGIPESTFILLKTQTGDIESLKYINKKGELDTIDNSKGLQIMKVIYDCPGLKDSQRKKLFEYFDVGKKVRHYNKALVNEKLSDMRKQAK